MTTRDIVHDELDNVIDRVARELTAARPPADLRARVMDRIANVPPRPRFVWHWRVALVPAVAAIVLVAVVLRHRTESQISTPPVAHTAHAIAETPTATVTNAAASGSTIATRRTKNARIHKAGAEELAWRERAIAALTPVDPLDLTDIQPAPLSIPQLEVKPLGPSADGGSPDGGSPN